MAKGIDWETIRQLYEDTMIPIREIARQHGIVHGSIQRRAKKESWKRIDLDNVVMDKALVGKDGILSPVALRKMEEVKNELGDNYSSLDEPLVAAFALNYQKWIDVQKIILSEGSTMLSSKGSVYISPYENLAKMYENTFMKIAGQLGLSLASRKRFSIDVSSKRNEVSLFDIKVDMYDEVKV